VVGASGLDTSREWKALAQPWEQYETRYTARPETYRAYVDVWLNVPAATEHFTGWASFSQAANAEPAQRRRPERVALAERIMADAGYVIIGSTQRGARRWGKSRLNVPKLERD
jgi:hypothetical protein